MKTKNYYDGLVEELRDEVEAAAYLDAALEDEDPRVFLLALRCVALAQGGIQALARKTKLHRVNLNRMLSEKGNPELRSLAVLFQEMGLRLRVEPAPRRKASRRQTLKRKGPDRIATKERRGRSKPIQPRTKNALKSSHF